MQGWRSDAYDPYLETERGEDQSGDQDSEDIDSDVASKIVPGKPIPALAHDRVRVIEVAGDPGAKEQTAYAVGEQTCRIKQKDVGLSLLSLGQEEENHQKHQRCAEANSIADTNTEVVNTPSIEVLPAGLHQDPSAVVIRHGEVQGLGPWVKVGRDLDILHGIFHSAWVSLSVGGEVCGDRGAMRGATGLR